MVLQNFLSKNDRETSKIFLNISSKDAESAEMISNRSVKCKSDMLCKSVTGMLLFLFILNIVFIFISLNKNMTINRLQDQVASLQSDVDMLKYRFFDDNLLNEIAEFELESYSDDSQTQSDSEADSDDYMTDSDGTKDANDNNDEDNDFSDYDLESSRNKREIMASTLDGVPIIHESYAEQKRRNRTAGTTTANTDTIATGEGLRLYESLGKHTPTKHTYTSGWTTRTYMKNGPKRSNTPLVTRKSRVMHTDEDKHKAFRKVVKKSAPTQANQLQEHVEAAPVTVLPPTRRGHRHGNKGRGKSRRSGNLMETADVVAAQYFGNTSHLVPNSHHGYRGNGHLAHPKGQFVNWEPSSWVKEVGADRIFQLQEGTVIVRESGLYLIYAQIYYVDEHDLNGFQIMCNRDELAVCTTMTHTAHKMDKRNSCFTATIAALNDGDRVRVQDIETHRYVHMTAGKSFFGLYKIADYNFNQHHHNTHAHTIK